jgi:hypothetical protein
VPVARRVERSLWRCSAGSGRSKNGIAAATLAGPARGSSAQSTMSLSGTAAIRPPTCAPGPGTTPDRRGRGLLPPHKRIGLRHLAARTGDEVGGRPPERTRSRRVRLDP